MKFTDFLLDTYQCLCQVFGILCDQDLTPKQLETHECVFSNVATDGLVLKHQTISTHSADEIIFVLEQFHTEILYLNWTTQENKITFWKK